MNMMSLRQLRAARALLDWKQSELAIKSGFSLTALNNIERGAVSPRASTLDLIQKTFEQEGVKFTEDDGVKLRPDVFDVKTFEGSERDVVKTHFRDILDTAGPGGTACYGGVDEAYFIRHFRKECFEFYGAAQTIGLKERILISEGVKERYGPKNVSEYRALPKELFGLISYAIYGNKYTLIHLGKRSRWVSIEHPAVAQVHRQLFEAHWKLGRFVPYTKPLFDEDLEKFKI